MKATVRWQENMIFVGMLDSGFPVELDADSYFGGTNNGVRPREMVALGLAGRTALEVLSILQKKRQNITGFEVKVDAPRSPEHPQVFTGAVIHYIVTGKNVTKTAVLRAIELSFTKYCTVQKMLDGAFPIELRYEIYEDAADGTPRLTSQGNWQELSVE
jgi:putative redox protein